MRCGSFSEDEKFEIKSHPQKSFTGSPLLWQGIIKRQTESSDFCFPSFRVSQELCWGGKSVFADTVHICSSMSMYLIRHRTNIKVLLKIVMNLINDFQKQVQGLKFTKIHP